MRAIRRFGASQRPTAARLAVHAAHGRAVSRAPARTGCGVQSPAHVLQRHAAGADERQSGTLLLPGTGRAAGREAQAKRAAAVTQPHDAHHHAT